MKEKKKRASRMIKYLVGIVVLLAWIGLLSVLNKAKLDFWKYIVGSAGLFIFLMVFVEPLAVKPLARIVALAASVPGKIGGWYQAYFKYSTIFVDSGVGAISLKIDFECSGIIEIIAFVSLIAFYSVYTVSERIWVGILGVIGIVMANALRIVIICLVLYFAGIDMYYVAHTFIGRIVFYSLSVVLYFYVFTKPQIIKQKVGIFRYDSDK